MKNNNKIKNIITGVIIALMVVVAGAVVIRTVGLPDVTGFFKPNYEEQAAERAESQKSILGSWEASGDPGFTIDIWKDADGGFHAIVNKSENDGTVMYWQMDGVWQDFEQGFFYSTGKKSLATYDMDGNVSETVYYEDGTGNISATDDGIVWNDEKEKAGDGITFVYIGEY